MDSLGHEYGEWETTKAATCTEAGSRTKTCTRKSCTAETEGHQVTEAIAALGHSLTKVEAKEATTTAEGNIEYYTCSVCEKCFSDAEGKTEITRESTVIPKKTAPQPPVTTQAPTGSQTPAATQAPTVTQAPDATQDPQPDNTDDKKEDPAKVNKGTTATDTKTGGSYKVTTSGTSNNNKAAVEYVKPVGKAAKATAITIPNTVKVDGVVCKVTSIKANAFANNKKVKSITVGKNIVKIGKKAFYKCKKVKTIKIKSTKLTKKNIGKNAFKGINAKVKIKVPKSKLKAYKKLFRNKGLSKKVKIVKL